MTKDLIHEIQERPEDERRWAHWYKQAYPKVFYVAFRFAGGKTELARDLTQEAFARFLMYKAIDRVSSEGHALNFLIRTCRNLAIDSNAADAPLLNVPIEVLDSLQASEEAPEATLDLDLLARRLDPEDRQMLEWTREGLSVADVARRLGLTYTAAGVRLHRLRTRLRELHAKS